MALAPPDELEFEEADPSELLEVLSSLVPGQWVNLLPEVEPGMEPPARNPVVSLFSSRGDDVPMVTWSAPSGEGKRTMLGFTHGSGPRALDRLAEDGLGLPDGWLKVNDHPKRGVVVTAPRGAATDEVLTWVLSAAHALSRAPLTGSWLAQIYEP